jgi:hypothetical protein
VKIIVNMDFKRYYRLLAKCEMSSREYAIMKNSILEHESEHAQDSGTFTIVCEVGEAKMLLNHANRVYPDAIADIEQSIVRAREP